MITSGLIRRTLQLCRLRTTNSRGGVHTSNYFYSRVFPSGLTSLPVKHSIAYLSTSLLSQIPKETKKPRVMFITNSHNGMSQRAKTFLEDHGFTVNVELAVSPSQMVKSTKVLKPDIIICPFLTSRVPDEIWKNPEVPCIIVHPGVQGDRGMSSIEWAMEGKNAFGVTCLSAVEEMDAGPVWATRVVETSNRVDPSGLTKSSIYKNEITEAAIDAISETIVKFMNGKSPTKVEVNDPNTLGTLRQTMSIKDRQVSFVDQTAEEIAHCINLSDGQPGAKVTLNNGETFFAFDVHVEGDFRTTRFKTTKDIATVVPGDIIAKRGKAVAFMCKDGQVLWIGHAKRKRNGIKLPASECLKMVMADDTPEWPLVSVDFVAQNESNLWKKPIQTYMENWTYTLDRVCYIFFDVYNGAMDTNTCKRVEESIHRAASRADIDAIVLTGGYNTFSNGVNLNIIESAKQNRGYCEQESWENINAINDVVKALFSIKDKVTLSALRGNAGAGGVMMALAADAVWTHSNVVLNPHYLSMGLHGSEYWTYFLPEKVGSEVATQLTQEKQAISAYRASQLGLVDQTFGSNVIEFQQELHKKVTQYMVENHKAILSKKEQALSEAKLMEIDCCRTKELAIMKHNFQSKEFKASRKAFVTKQKPLATPIHLTQRRGQVMSGRKVANKILENLEERVKGSFASGSHRMPKLSILLVGDRADSKLYVEKKIAAAEKLGIIADLHHFCDPENSQVLQEKLIETICHLNDNKDVDGIMLQVPTMFGVNANEVVPFISPNKDVDCLNPMNFHGCLNPSSKYTKFLPPCPEGIIDLLLAYGTPLKGQHAVVVGSSVNLGWPIACLLEREGCQVTVLNLDGSLKLKDFISSADIVVSAVGKSNIITEDMVKPGSVLVDAGISFDNDGNLLGDISTSAKSNVAGMYTPVPNGVGPMTVAKLMENVIKSYEMNIESRMDEEDFNWKEVV